MALSAGNVVIVITLCFRAEGSVSSPLCRRDQRSRRKLDRSIALWHEPAAPFHQHWRALFWRLRRDRGSGALPQEPSD
jgi:hypothetical protein